MKYAEARAIVTAKDYKPVRAAGCPMHPIDAHYTGPSDGWGSDYAKRAFYENQLIGYVGHYFNCWPEPGERAKYINQEEVK